MGNSNGDDRDHPQHTINDLRRHLFVTIEDLRNPQNPMDVDRANAIKGVASEIINSAKIDLKFMEITGRGNEQFIGTTRQLGGPKNR